MSILFVAIICAGAFLLWYLPVPRERTRRLATQAGGSALFGLGIGGLLLQLMAPAAL